MYRIVLISLFMTLSCGDAKFVDKTQTNKEEKKTETPPSENPKVADSVPKKPGSPAEELPMAPKVDPSNLTLGYQFVKNAIDQECAVCHTNPQIIDFRKFPFEYEGSYTETLIKKEIESMPADESIRMYYASKVVIDEMIEALDSGYMPPTGKPTKQPQILDSLKTWRALSF